MKAFDNFWKSNFSNLSCFRIVSGFVNSSLLWLLNLAASTQSVYICNNITNKKLLQTRIVHWSFPHRSTYFYSNVILAKAPSFSNLCYFKVLIMSGWLGSHEFSCLSLYTLDIVHCSVYFPQKLIFKNLELFH